MPTDPRPTHPPFLTAALTDARVTAAFRGERFEFRSRLDTVAQMARLVGQSDAYAAQLCYRLRVRLRAAGVPVLPRLLRALSMLLAQVDIGDDVVVGPGLYLAHGQVTISGAVTMDRSVVVFPWATIDGHDGPVVIGRDARIGTGSVIEGPVRVGTSARIGANAHVTEDVPDGGVRTGVPGPSSPSPATAEGA